MLNISDTQPLRRLAQCAVALLALNEVRGSLLAIPVLYDLAVHGGTVMRIWLAFSALGGIALSVFLPVWAARRLTSRSALSHTRMPASF
jgi:hypothetical protein